MGTKTIRHTLDGCVQHSSRCMETGAATAKKVISSSLPLTIYKVEELFIVSNEGTQEF